MTSPPCSADLTAGSKRCACRAPVHFDDDDDDESEEEAYTPKAAPPSEDRRRTITPASAATPAGLEGKPKRTSILAYNNIGDEATPESKPEQRSVTTLTFKAVAADD